jgi:hypothetical protein
MQNAGKHGDRPGERCEATTLFPDRIPMSPMVAVIEAG